jgi:phage terminase large subunit
MKKRLKSISGSLSLSVTEKQGLFISSDCDEVFFGGAAGGGKSYGQLVDALRFALEFEGSKQLILRRTFPELERSLIMESLKLYPNEAGKYIKSERRWYFGNGSTIEFGYCDAEGDVTKYQSAEYDVIRFDEVTHFSEFQYTYLISRIRGVNPCPKQIKSTGNPGGVGHSFIKERFIDKGKWGERFDDSEGRSYIFIPARVQDNHYLMRADKNYLKRLNQLPEYEKKRLLYGDWDAFEGRYFPEFYRQTHILKPFEIPKHWTRFRSLDYGLDMTACLWWAVDEQGRAFIYREFYEKNLNLSQAAKAILKHSLEGEKIEYTVASPDLWNRRQETGLSGFQIMTEAGLEGLIRANDNRIAGWRALREWLTPFEDEIGVKRARLSFFDGACPNLVRCLPLLQFSPTNAEDCANNPHEITHAPDSLRYGIMSRPQAAEGKTSLQDVFGIFKTSEEENLKGFLSF